MVVGRPVSGGLSKRLPSTFFHITRHPWPTDRQIQFLGQNVPLPDVHRGQVVSSAFKEPLVGQTQTLLFTCVAIQIFLDCNNDFRREARQLQRFFKKIAKVGVWDRGARLAPI